MLTLISKVQTCNKQLSIWQEKLTESLPLIANGQNNACEAVWKQLEKIGSAENKFVMF